MNVINRLDREFDEEYSKLYIVAGLVWSVCGGLDHATTKYALTFDNVHEVNSFVEFLGFEVALVLRICVIIIAIFGFMNMEESHSLLFREKYARYIKFGGLGLLTSIFLLIVINNSYVIYVASM